LAGTSPELPSNLGMSEGSLVGIDGQLALWCMGSLINWIKSRRLNPTMKGSNGATGIVLVTIPLDVMTGVEPEPTLTWFPTPVVDLDMMKICGEGGSESDEESDEPKEELVWGLGGG